MTQKSFLHYPVKARTLSRYARLTDLDRRLGYARTSTEMDAVAEVANSKCNLWKSWTQELTSQFSQAHLSILTKCGMLRGFIKTMQSAEIQYQYLFTVKTKKWREKISTFQALTNELYVWKVTDSRLRYDHRRIKLMSCFALLWTAQSFHFLSDCIPRRWPIGIMFFKLRDRYVYEGWWDLGQHTWIKVPPCLQGAPYLPPGTYPN